MKIIIFLMILDIISGILKGVYLKKLQSGLMLRGIIKKSFVLIILSIIFIICKENIIPLELYDITYMFFIFEQIISILENYIEIGGKLPKEFDKVFKRGIKDE